MEITTQTPIADLVLHVPAAIAVLQRYGVPFCCTGATPLSAACDYHDIDPARLLADIEIARRPHMQLPEPDAPLSGLVEHIRRHYHEPFLAELPRISAMLDKLVRRHGARLPEVLPPLQSTFEPFRRDLAVHIARIENGLFRSIEQGGVGVQTPIAGHAALKAPLARMRALTGSYTPPEDACSTFRGAYYALSELERAVHLYAHIEREMLLPAVMSGLTR